MGNSFSGAGAAGAIGGPVSAAPQPATGKPGAAPVSSPTRERQGN